MNTTTYKTIPAQFHKKGFQYNQLKRDGMKAIFQQTKMGSTMNNYEVVKLGRHNGYTMGGMAIEQQRPILAVHCGALQVGLAAALMQPWLVMMLLTAE